MQGGRGAFLCGHFSLRLAWFLIRRRLLFSHCRRSPFRVAYCVERWDPFVNEISFQSDREAGRARPMRQHCMTRRSARDHPPSPRLWRGHWLQTCGTPSQYRRASFGQRRRSAAALAVSDRGRRRSPQRLLRSMGLPWNVGTRELRLERDPHDIGSCATRAHQPDTSIRETFDRGHTDLFLQATSDRLAFTNGQEQRPAH